jgi:hypothetical protein
MEHSEKVERVIYSITTEIMRVMALRNKAWARKFIGTMLKKPVRQMAEGWSSLMKRLPSGMEHDDEGGFGRICHRLQVKGAEMSPNGHLLIAYSHPGSYDIPIISTVWDETM